MVHAFTTLANHIGCFGDAGVVTATAAIEIADPAIGGDGNQLAVTHASRLTAFIGGRGC